MANKFLGPRPDGMLITSLEPLLEEAIMLSSNKHIVVVVNVTLTEDHNGDGKADEEKHEFDTINEAVMFAKNRRDPDSNPVETKIFRFENAGWTMIERASTTSMK